ncbi:MAG: hypothetical protein A2219_07840 [Elusimicrobia bacterium RIFOXYA2_FULL_50_26]|nr:MAG: hypothetical protein A2219_07840 [Elusimicrobia bacterium RIFOXYA2_FULL_50_26]OGS22354.1 MAG: hypothetical protein A2314_08240 [Elusimicrobia bacterium RIFOXYB2_FULL_50_12]
MKKHCRYITLIVSVVFFAGAAARCFADKKDVTDPVLKEIISSFGDRMPKFIDKHGADIFVVDGTVTRGALMQVFYEYDKSLKIPRKEAVSRQELDEIKRKLAILEKNIMAPPPSLAKNDMMQLINELMPNMPALLDNSLMNSKVFASLRDQVHSANSAGTATSAGTVDTREIDELGNRIALLEKKLLNAPVAAKHNASSDDTARLQQAVAGMDQRLKKLEGRPQATASGVSGTDINKIIGELRPEIDDIVNESVKDSNADSKSSSREMLKNIAKTRSDIAKINRRLETIETKSGAQARKNGGTSLSSAGSTLTKVTLGLSMVAAFFIAR